MKVTIVILTFNGEEYLKEVIEGILAQDVDFEYEILIIDSGSSDRTLTIINQFPSIRLHTIQKENFGHGKTRNVAVQMAKGEIVVFLTQDATPATKFWLKEMVRPFDLNPQIAAVFGMQKPRWNCCCTVKNEVLSAFQSFGSGVSLSFQQKSELVNSQDDFDLLTFFSDVNSAVRKEHNKRIPYRDVEYAEDQLLGIDIIKAGLVKVYTPFGAVFHSHNYNVSEYFRRKYTETVEHQKVSGRFWSIGFADYFIAIVKGVISDWFYITKDKEYTLLKKAKWVMFAPIYQIVWKSAIFLAGRKGRIITRIKNVLFLNTNY